MRATLLYLCPLVYRKGTRYAREWLTQRNSRKVFGKFSFGAILMTKVSVFVHVDPVQER
jgi:hypothetical protein